MFARNVITLIVPLTIILLAVPLILQKIPRNGFYGFRTVFTMSSDEVWYHANKIAGFSLLVAGILWLVLGRVLLVHVRDEAVIDASRQYIDANRLDLIGRMEGGWYTRTTERFEMPNIPLEEWQRHAR